MVYITAMWPKLYVLTLYILWEYMLDLNTKSTAFLSVVIFLVFFLATRSYKCHLPTKTKPI